ncbi:MAG: dTMP kinase [Chitinivibrionales bacterium]|nr:dTMP kinase [Chitinivibrionales bacterium]
MKRGLFITFEGIDGCGKSTQVAKANERLSAAGMECLVTREPGGTLIADKIRELVLTPGQEEMSSSCELLLYLASRAQHIHAKIGPALAAGKIILCDRFADATIAYQGFGRGVSLHILAELNGFATDGLAPDLTFIFDISVERAMQRLRALNKKADRLESEGEEFFKRIREGYLALAASNPSRIVLLQGEKSIEVLAEAVFQKINGRLAGR